jgi:hypothetical protein
MEKHNRIVSVRGIGTINQIFVLIDLHINNK